MYEKGIISTLIKVAPDLNSIDLNGIDSANISLFLASKLCFEIMLFGNGELDRV